MCFTAVSCHLVTPIQLTEAPVMQWQAMAHHLAHRDCSSGVVKNHLPLMRGQEVREVRQMEPVVKEKPHVVGNNLPLMRAREAREPRERETVAIQWYHYHQEQHPTMWPILASNRCDTQIHHEHYSFLTCALGFMWCLWDQDILGMSYMVEFSIHFLSFTQGMRFY